MAAEGGRETVTSEGISTGREGMEAASNASLTLLLSVGYDNAYDKSCVLNKKGQCRDEGRRLIVGGVLTDT